MPTIVSLPLPIQLLNGNVADAGEVMTDLNAIASNVNANAAKNGVNSDITALNALISINSGVTIIDATLNNPDIVGGTMTGTAIDSTTTVPTAAPGTNTNQIASTAFVVQMAFSTVLPAQAGNAGKFLTTDGTSASWQFVNLSTNVIGQLPMSQGGTGGFSGAPDFLLFAQGVI